MATEQLIIPELPSTTPDLDSFVADVTEGIIAADELLVRIDAVDGYARLKDGTIATRLPNGTIIGVDIAETGSIQEDRQIDPDARELLKSLERKATANKTTEQSLRDTASYLEDVVAGTIPRDELEPRFNASGGYARIDGKRVTRDAEGSLVVTDRADIALRERRRASTTEQQQIILAVAKEKDACKTTEQSLRDTASYLEDVVAGTIPRDELEPRFNASGGYARIDGRVAGRRPDGEIIAVTDPGELAIREQRDSIPSKAQRVIVDISENILDRLEQSRQSAMLDIAARAMTDCGSLQDLRVMMVEDSLPDAATKELEQFYKLKGQVCDPKLDELITDYMKTGDESVLIRELQKAELIDTDLMDSPDLTRAQSRVRDYIQTARRINLKSRFWAAAQDTFDTQRLGMELDMYTSYDDDDRALVVELRDEAARLQCDGLIIETFRLLDNTTPDFERATENLRAIEKIIEIDVKSKKAVRQTLAAAVDVIFRAEVAVLFGGLYVDLGFDSAQIEMLQERVQSFSVRAAVAETDYFSGFEERRKTFNDIIDRLQEQLFEQQLVDLRRRFVEDRNIARLIEDIGGLVDGTEEDSELRQQLYDELALIVAARKGLDPERYSSLQELSREELRTRRAADDTLDLNATPERRNIAAVRNIVRRFKQGIEPLFQTIRGGENGQSIGERFIGRGPRQLYVQKISRLEEQRPLLDTERAYLESVELLTLFNPHLVALARERPQLTSLFLESYFQKLSSQTKEQLTDECYFPLVQFGLGPEGVAAAGELNRSNPKLAQEALYVDAGFMPGGPFAIPLGPSWQLNSASSLGQSTNVLQDLTDAEKLGAAVRSYGSPLVAYPGERREGEGVRRGSINATVDYLPNPDNTSPRRYPTNVDEARIVQLQTALLVDNVLLSSTFVRIINVDDGRPGNKKLIIDSIDDDGRVRTFSVRTDNVVFAGGPGVASLGIKLEGSKAQEVLMTDNEAPNGFPRITDGLTAFKIMSDPTDQEKAPSGVVVVSGGGNTKDTLLEYMGRQFDSGNPLLNGIERFVIISDAPTNGRPRYFEIIDLEERNGKPNFVAKVKARLGDVSVDKEGLLTFFDTQGEPLFIGSNGGTQVLKGNHWISAAGFMPNFDKAFVDLLAQGESIDRKEGLAKVTLPTNPGFSIANQLTNDPSVVFVGTISEPDFDNPIKLAQLPGGAREALVRNGKVNAVAIGFRAPDTRAAIRLKFGNTPVETVADINQSTEPRTIDVRDTMDDKSTVRQVARTSYMPRTRRDVDADSETLTSLFLSALPTKLRLSTDESRGFAINIVPVGDNLIVETTSEGVPRQLLDIIASAASDPYFQAYAFKAIAGRRSNKGLTVQLSFSNGRLRLRDGGSDAPEASRTFVEAL